MKHKPLHLFFALLLYCLPTGLAQETNRFEVGLILGLNFAELEGRDLTEYIGLNAGVFGKANLSASTKIGVELLFSRNGEYVLPQFYPRINYGKIRLDHLEIPIYVDWAFRIAKQHASKRLNLQLGLAYARLLRYYAEDINTVEVTDQIIYGSRDAYLLQTGILYHFTPNLGFNLKGSLPIRESNLDLSIAARIVYRIL